MVPLLSIIIPTYNHNSTLPALLDSIAAQDFKDHEVVLVDDCSDEPCDSLVEALRNKGMNLRLFRNAERQYTKNTRLNGVEQARGELITFADADDIFYGTTALGFHVNMLRETNADLLHFVAATYRENVIKRADYDDVKPFADRLDCAQIFESYVAKKFPSRVVYGKIATCNLWRRCLPAARAIGVRRYREDVLLTSLLYFHAERYQGSQRIGYKRIWKPDEFKAIGRMASNYYMLTELIPYIRRNGASAATADAMEAWLLRGLHNFVWQTVEQATATYATMDAVLCEMEQHAPLEVYVRSFLLCYPQAGAKGDKARAQLLQNFIVSHFGAKEATELLQKYVVSLG